ncbi:MAG TPA: hypothetical protein VJI70_04000 [Candidatus Paceibacterota bacterium]
MNYFFTASTISDMPMWRKKDLLSFGHLSTQPYRNVWITIYPQVTTTVVY